jgi:hypothetical protein
LQNLTVAQMFKKYCHWYLSEPDESSLHPPFCLFNITFNIILPSTCKSFCGLYPSCLSTTIFMNFSSLLFVLHTQKFSLFRRSSNFSMRKFIRFSSTSCRLEPNILLSILFSVTLASVLFLTVTDQVSCHLLLYGTTEQRGLSPSVFRCFKVLLTDFRTNFVLIQNTWKLFRNAENIVTCMVFAGLIIMGSGLNG